MAPRNEPLVTILANPHCPHCVHATDLLTEWCCEQGVAVAGVNIARHPEVAQKRHVEHSPAVIYRSDAGEEVVAGFPTHDEFLQLTGGHGR